MKRDNPRRPWQARRQPTCAYLSGLLRALDAGERSTAAVTVPNCGQDGYLMMVTRQGRAKRLQLSTLNSVRPSGLIAIRLEEGDELGWASLTQGNQHVIIITEQGQALRFREDTVRPMGRTAAGVNAIKLASGDYVASACVLAQHPEAVEGSEADLLVVTTKGYGKRTPLSEFPVKGRYGQGVRCLGGKREGTGIVAAARVVHPKDQVTLVSAGGMVLRTPVTNIPQMGRATRGAKVMDLKPGDETASVAVVEGNSHPKSKPTAKAIKRKRRKDADQPV